MKFGVVVFPGSNCDHDAYHVVSKHVGQPVDFIWHKQTDLSSFDVVIIPGGFSYGDYLRAGALARFSPVMESVKKFAAAGKFVFGICNGFQILCEAGLLPGALRRNAGSLFICRHVDLKLDNPHTPFTENVNPERVLSIPDRPRRRQLHLRRRDVQLARRKRPDRLSLLRRRRRGHRRRESQRLTRQHRRHLQPGPQRPRHDAPPRTRLRRSPRLQRRPRHLPLADHHYQPSGGLTRFSYISTRTQARKMRPKSDSRPFTLFCKRIWS